MRVFRSSKPGALLTTAVLFARPLVASLLSGAFFEFDNAQDVRKRCDNPCGYYGQVCCASNEVCYTDASNQAQCSVAPNAAVKTVTVTSASPSGEYQFFTTTFLQTDLKTVTQTYSSFVPAATLACTYALGQSLCGNVCCLSGQFCQSPGTCVEVGGGSSGFYSSLFTVTTVVTNTASAPLRPTSNTLVTVTTIGGGATTTQPFATPVGTDGSLIYGTSSGSSGGLSGGAIAGIVIGVIAGIILLLLICACCCFKGLIDGLLAIFGLGPKPRRRTEEEVYIDRRSHRGGRTWFGTRPGRTEVVEEKRRSGIGTAGWVAASLGALALWLGLKRRNRRDDKSTTGYGSSYYSDYTVSSSESSSDRRTRRSSRSRSRR